MSAEQQPLEAPQIIEQPQAVTYSYEGEGQEVTTQYTTTATYHNAPYTVGGAQQYTGLAQQYQSAYQQPQYQYAYDAQGQLVMVPAQQSYGYQQNPDGSWSLSASPGVQYMTEDGQLVTETEAAPETSTPETATETTAPATATTAQYYNTIPTIQSMTIPAYQYGNPYQYNYGITAGGAGYPGAAESAPVEKKKSKSTCQCW